MSTKLREQLNLFDQETWNQLKKENFVLEEKENLHKDFTIPNFLKDYSNTFNMRS